MADEKFEVSKEMQEQAKTLIVNAFQLLKDHNRKMAEDKQEFEEMDKRVTERMQRGTRRTSGRII